MSSLDKNKTLDKKYWRSLEQLDNKPEYQRFAKNEFPEEDTEKNHPVSRRTFLSTVGTTLAFAGLTGCRRPVEKIVPYVDAPENLVLGEPEYYATSMPLGTSSYGLVVTCHEGRPVKIEGNELHPSSLGKSNNFMQASILNLYDPDRSRKITNKGKESSWQEFEDAWKEIKTEFDENGGEGLVILGNESSSPSFERLKKEFFKTYPKAEWVTFNSVSDENIYGGIRIASGKNLQPVYHYDKAKIIVALDADPFMMDSENVTSALGFAKGRSISGPHDKMNRLYVAEPGYTITGAMADHRLRIKSSQVIDFTVLLARALESRGTTIPALSAFGAVKQNNIDQRWIDAVADDLISHKGKSLVVAGRRQPKAVHALILSINYALENIDNTIEFHIAEHIQVSDRAALKNLVANIDNGKVNTLVVLSDYPVATIPFDLQIIESLKKIQRTYKLSSSADSVSALLDGDIHSAHNLASWGDCRSMDGTPAIIQPMIEPLFFGKSVLEVLNLIIYGESQKGYNIVRETWKDIFHGESFELSWRKALHDGVYPEGKTRVEPVIIQEIAIEAHLKEFPIENNSTGMEIVFTADHSVYDGRFSNNGWMQELPDPLTKLIWDNAALISTASAKMHGLENGDFISIESGDNSIEIPVWILPGQADDVIILPLGYGNDSNGRIEKGAGFSVNGIRTIDNMDFLSGTKVTRTGKKHVFATTQNHGSMEGRPLIREADLDEYRNDPEFAQHEVHVPDLASLWKEHKYDEGNQWGMSIDLNACIGCGACTISCQSENNIPVVGKEQADYGREMHWMRIDRYFNGDLNNPEIGFQPMACQHCEMAPCEQVCPVAATTHDAEGLNVMTYNRCIGTRYCSNNCAYKVRRFNFFNYTNRLPELVKMAQNPDVTVRSRGVMEKCTFCLQRINRTKRRAKLEGRTVMDGEMRTACQQACPTEAIKFGNILDKKSSIVKAKNSERTYEVLAELNLRPRTSYQARLRNPNPALKS
ncbi:MAG: TAT-variant-translocated molybdopterin oxidoreductase [Candidatus Electryonea clarkiae]|nr:TAT-variant-translocated molybdopterin oxidoreductase [Candidatus Electryonea clarkiae]MDP8287755.1 TAT-variant-translocated molybdopterin oxidoreductase [Candidatus Electryonea clarkiae]